MSVKNFVQCGLVTPIATNTTELVLVAPTASYQYPPLDGGTLVIADSVARPTFYEVISYTHRIDNVLYGVVRGKESTTARSWAGSVWVYQALTAQDYVDALALKANAANATLTGVPTAPTAAPGTNTNQIATMAALQVAIAALIESSPAALNTLNELAAALGDDPNFASTMTTALAGKEPSIAAGTAAQLWLGNKTWATVLSQVHATLLTGLAAGSNSTILATDTLIAALAKIQNQLNNKAASSDSRLTDAREWTAAEVTQAEAEAGALTTVRKWSPLRVWQAVLASSLTGINLTLGTAVTAADTVLIAIGKLQKQITDAATNLTGNVRATVLTGFVNTANTPIVAADSVLVALGKAQAQINDKAAASHTHSYAPLTGAGTSGSWPISVTGSAAACSGNSASASAVAWSGVSGKPTTLEGYGITNGYAMNGVNTGWFRSSGTQGWYNETYNGGIYMTDATYVRTYNGKSFLCNSVMRVEGTAPQVQLWDSDHSILRYLYADGGSMGFLNSSGNWSLINDNSGNTTSTGNVTAYSDIRLKKDIELIPDALDKVCTLRGVTYERIDSGERQTGVIAQEVQAVLPEAVMTMTDEQQTLSVAYGNLVGLLIEAIKGLKAEVDALKQGAK